ncbi:MAG: LolA family protein [Desulfosudaceae bacterium]
MLLIFPDTAALSQEQTDSSNPLSASEILNKLEKRYDCGGFTARFEQTSTLAAMDITDTATGQAFFKHPGKMRWEYQQPSPQQIITDGKRLWIHKPEENQVVVGEAPALFGEEPGVNFLTQIRQIKNQFQVELAEEEQQPARNGHVLKLTPRKDSSARPAEMETVYLTVSKENFNLMEIKTVSPYGDTTAIAFSKIALDRELNDELFTFDIPIDADVINLDNQQP